MNQILNQSLAQWANYQNVCKKINNLNDYEIHWNERLM